MSITNVAELTGMQKVSEAVAYTLKAMRGYAEPGMTTKQLDSYGAKILSDFGAKSAPFLTYIAKLLPKNFLTRLGLKTRI